MLTAAKYYAAALFLVAVTFAAAVTAPTEFATVLSNLPADESGRLEVARSLVHTWLLLSAAVAVVGLAVSLWAPSSGKLAVAATTCFTKPGA